MKTLEDMWVSLIFISGRLSEDFMRLLDKYEDTKIGWSQKNEKMEAVFTLFTAHTS